MIISPEELGTLRARVAELEAERDGFRRNLRDSFEAMCAMRDSINEYLPMSSLESDLLQGPETSVFCATIAEAVVTELARRGQGAQVKPLIWSSAVTMRGHDHFSDYGYIIRGDDDCVLELNGRVLASGLPLEASKTTAQTHHKARIRAALVSPGDGWTANCCHCGRIIDTREKEDGGDAFGCQHDDNRWTCSDECSEAAYPLPDWLKGVGDAPPASEGA